MEDAFSFIIVIIGVVASISSAIKKNRNSKAAAKPHWPSAADQPQPAEKKEPHPYTPAQPTILPPVTASDIPGQVIAPTVHTHVQPDCETHDAPSGSLYVTTDEGKDPCHEPQLTHARTNQEPAEQEEGGLTFDWSGQNMVKAFVMQEILTRPASRTPVCPRQAR